MPQPSPLEAALLGLLADNPASGYELRKVFQTTPLATYSDSPGAIYPALRRLEDRGLVATAPSTGARRRTPYRLTSAGRAWLRRWIARPVTQEEVARTPAVVDLRLALISHVTPRRLRPFLREYASALQSHHASVQQAAKALDGVLLPSAVLALSLGIHLLGTRRDWCRRAAERVMP